MSNGDAGADAAGLGFGMAGDYGGPGYGYAGWGGYGYGYGGYGSEYGGPGYTGDIGGYGMAGGFGPGSGVGIWGPASYSVNPAFADPWSTVSFDPRSLDPWTPVTLEPQTQQYTTTPGVPGVLSRGPEPSVPMPSPAPGMPSPFGVPGPQFIGSLDPNVSFPDANVSPFDFSGRGISDPAGFMGPAAWSGGQFGDPGFSLGAGPTGSPGNPVGANPGGGTGSLGFFSFNGGPTTVGQMNMRIALEQNPGLGSNGAFMNDLMHLDPQLYGAVTGRMPYGIPRPAAPSMPSQPGQAPPPYDPSWGMTNTDPAFMNVPPIAQPQGFDPRGQFVDPNAGLLSMFGGR